MINIQKIDNNESFIWSIVKYLNPANYCSVKITKPNKDFAQKVEFKDIKFLVKKLETFTKSKIAIGISILDYESKERHVIYVSKNVMKKNMLS